MSAAADSAEFADWIGRTTERTDRVSERLLVEFRATLAPHLADREVPPGLHWCLAPDAFPLEALGEDGHPRLGLVLPPVPFPRRMWAGGVLRLHGELAPGDEVAKSSEIADIAFKSGRSGALCFVTVRHTYTVSARVVIEERQDIVYREASGAGVVPPEAPSDRPAARWVVEPTSTLLFRYSALTFNGHRIHYDAPYAREVEGYDGLVVHGPLQATLMLNLATTHLGRQPREFVYRGAAPLVLGAPFAVEAHEGAGGLSLKVRAGDGRVTFTAEASG